MLGERLSASNCCNTSGVTLVSKDVPIVASNERVKLCCDGVIWCMASVLITYVSDNERGKSNPPKLIPEG